MKNFNFKEFQSLQHKVDARNQQRGQNAGTSFLEAVELINKFYENNLDKRFLSKAAEKLIQAIENNRSQAEPYAYLAFIYYVLDQDKLAVKYLKIARSFNPDLPEVIKLQEVMSTNISGNVTLRKIQPVTNSSELNNQEAVTEKPAKIQKIQRVQPIRKK